MTLLRTMTTLSVMMVLSVGLPACSSSQSPQTTVEHQQDQPHESGSGHETATATANQENTGYLEMGSYKFKLAPEIMKSGETHMDFYVHDAKDQHLLGVTGTFHITMPDGTKKDLAIEEEKPYEHYHGKLILTQFGDYQVVAHVDINGEKFNPRFSFTRHP